MYLFFSFGMPEPIRLVHRFGSILCVCGAYPFRLLCCVCVCLLLCATITSLFIMHSNKGHCASCCFLHVRVYLCVCVCLHVYIFRSHFDSQRCFCFFLHFHFFSIQTMVPLLYIMFITICGFQLMLVFWAVILHSRIHCN